MFQYILSPVSIKKYRDFNFSRSLLRTSQFKDTDIAEMQSLLEKDPVYINEYLNALNEKQNISNIRWDRSICKYITRKRVKIPKKKLYLLFILSCMMVYTLHLI